MGKGISIGSGRMLKQSTDLLLELRNLLLEELVLLPEIKQLSFMISIRSLKHSTFRMMLMESRRVDSRRR